MYHQTTTASQVDLTFRIFSPIILFHDASTGSSDNHVIELKKQKVNAMLKTNGQFWSNVIASTRNNNALFSSPPQTPPPTLFNSSSSSSSVSSADVVREQKYYGTPSADDTEMDTDLEEEEDKEIVPAPLTTTTKKTRVKSTNGRKRRGNLPKSVTAILKQWLIDHCRHPYPTEEEKRCLRLKTNLTLNQISNWFINARRRILPVILSEPSTAAVQDQKENNSNNVEKKKTRKRRGWMSDFSSADNKNVKQLCPKRRQQPPTPEMI